jgi:hypothetical protein
MTEPYLQAWIALAVSTCLSAGLGLLAWPIVFEHGLPEGPDRPLFFPVLYSAFCVPASVVVLATRRRFLRLPVPMQRTLAGVSCLLTGASFGWLFIQIISH